MNASCQDIEIQPQPTTKKGNQKARGREYRHHEEYSADGDNGINRFEQAKKNSRFGDPYIELMYSTRPKRYGTKSAKDILGQAQRQSDSDTPVAVVQEPEKIRYDDRYYTKIYRNPILNKREKFTGRAKDVEVVTTKTESPRSSYGDAYGESEARVQSNSSNNCCSSTITVPVYKAPVIKKTPETYADARARRFYSSTYMRSYDHETCSGVATAVSPSSSLHTVSSSGNGSSKLRPLSGNLVDCIVKGKYHNRLSGTPLNCLLNSSYSNTSMPICTSSVKPKMDSIIFPYKN